jgi:hypothetical protein
MRFVFAVLTALSLGIGGFVATGHNPTSAGPVSLFWCRPQYRIFNCFLPTTTTTTTFTSTD